MFVTHAPNSYVEILSPKVIILGDEAFGRWKDRESGVLRNEINALIKEVWGSFFALSTTWNHSDNTAACMEGLSPDTPSILP